MRIAINTRLMLKGRMDGIGWFAAETTRRMAAQHPEHTFYLFFDRPPDPQFITSPNIVPVSLCPQARHPVLWYMFFEWSVKSAIRKYHIDIFLSPDGMMPLHLNIPSVNVIHDLNFEHYPSNIKASHQLYMTLFFPRFAQNATRLATVSEYSKSDISKTYHIPPSKIDVVYDGSHDYYRPHSESEKADTRSKFTDRCPYIIFVSTILKRKNLANLLLAFDIYKSQHPDNLKLLVVGNRAWWQDELAEAYSNMHHREDVILAGRIDADQLSAMLSAAEALVYPSFFEGFGIPILEAMYAETAVICSNTTSMPEVAGNAALLIDPSSPQQIADAISKIRFSSLREELIEAGRIQRNAFSWDKTAALLWDSITKAVKEK